MLMMDVREFERWSNDILY